eukprot:NODE_7224_length_1598_cov_5.721278.p1 GENE.NODE_7224_length_1598_cov_5.721278~~NODE_7224_length_1598_cov_5.721278.p1  ORF type:complete len:395 (+),score=88.44 NODE_7224_length_1598_cov_5.721278:135-1187(+)
MTHGVEISTQEDFQSGVCAGSPCDGSSCTTLGLARTLACDQEAGCVLCEPMLGCGDDVLAEGTSARLVGRDDGDAGDARHHRSTTAAKGSKDCRCHLHNCQLPATDRCSRSYPLFVPPLRCCAPVLAAAEVQLISGSDGVALSAIQNQRLPDLAMKPRLEGEVCCATLPAEDTGLPTTRLQNMHDRLEIPALSPHFSPTGEDRDESNDVKDQRLLKMFREFTVELNRGMRLVQFVATRGYVEVHCQLTDDLETLKLDEYTGCIIEFPLRQVAKMSRLMKHTLVPRDDRSTQLVAEHLVTIDFVNCRLVFVYVSAPEAHRFMTCLQLLVARAQYKGKHHVPLVSAFPVRTH